MPYIVIDTSNNFNPIHSQRFATEQEAIDSARELLKTQPAAVLMTAQLLKRYTAQVRVTEQDPEPAEQAEPAEGEE